MEAGISASRNTQDRKEKTGVSVSFLQLTQQLFDGHCSGSFAKGLSTVNHVSMTNLIAGKKVLPELLQNGATVDTISAELGNLLNNKNKIDSKQKEYVKNNN